MTLARTRSQRGWTLVELLVAMTVALFLIAGIGQIYLAAKHSYEVQTSLAEIQDVGRYTVEALTQDIHMAGYWGLMDTKLAKNMAKLTGVPVPPPPGVVGCAAGITDWGKMVTQRMFGLNDTNPATSVPAYGCISDWLQGDILTVRYADPVAIPFAGPFTNTRLYIRTAPFQGSVAIGDPNSDALTLSTVTDPIHSDHALVAHAYYVSRNAASPVDCGGAAVTPPALARKILDSSGNPYKETLVNGVEQLQFQYGVDADADGSVNKYLDANNVSWTWPAVQRVQAVRVWVLVRATCPESGYTDNSTYKMGDKSYIVNDSYRRALFTTTVALRNCVDTLSGGSYSTNCS